MTEEKDVSWTELSEKRLNIIKETLEAYKLEHVKLVEEHQSQAEYYEDMIRLLSGDEKISDATYKKLMWKRSSEERPRFRIEGEISDYRDAAK